MQRIFAFILIITAIMVGCKKQAPQLPSNKGNVPDVEYETLLKANSALTEKEDSILKAFCEQSDIKYSKNELGFWYHKNQITDGKQIKEKDICEFELIIMTLDKKIRIKEIKKIVIGKKNTFIGLEEGLKIMRKGESATFVFPWYLAYGLKGYNDQIKPYTSIICEVKIVE